MAGFTGEPAQFAQAHVDVAETKGEMDNNLNSLRSNIEATQAGWQGPAAALFQQVMERFNEKSMKLNMALEDIAELLKVSGVEYEGKDQDVNDTLKNLAGSGGLDI